MKNFKILDNPQQSSYFGDGIDNDFSAQEEYYYSINHFNDYTQAEFLTELKKHATVKRQAGYSTLKKCDYLSLILVFHNSGDGEFTGHSIKSTCLIKSMDNDSIYDSNAYHDQYDEVSYSIQTIYHQLPNGKLIEYTLEETYEDDLQNIYEKFTKIRSYYLLNIKLPEKNTTSKIKKI